MIHGSNRVGPLVRGTKHTHTAGTGPDRAGIGPSAAWGASRGAARVADERKCASWAWGACSVTRGRVRSLSTDSNGDFRGENRLDEIGQIDIGKIGWVRLHEIRELGRQQNRIDLGGIETNIVQTVKGHIEDSLQLVDRPVNLRRAGQNQSKYQEKKTCILHFGVSTARKRVKFK